MATPLCPYFNKCGGCTTQHLDYSLQIEQKRKALAQAINYAEIKVFSGSEYSYRNRMDFVFHPQGLGLRESGKRHSIVHIQKCAISDERINQLLREVQEYFPNPDAFDGRKHTGTFRYAVIRAALSGDSSISFVLNEDSSRLREAMEKITGFSTKTAAGKVMAAFIPAKADVSVSENAVVVKGSEYLREQLSGKKFIFPIQGFFQNNSAMAGKMQEQVNFVLQRYDTSSAHLLDLYGGVGTFGIMNASLFAGVTIVDLGISIEAAKKNLEENSIANGTALALDAVQLKKIPFPKPLFVIADPPRTGMHPKTIEQLNALQPEVIIYISCNVPQLAKELPKLNNYKIRSAALFDLFPQTNHSEAMVELVKFDGLSGMNPRCTIADALILSSA